jgi:histidinol-phosphatase
LLGQCVEPALRRPDCFVVTPPLDDDLALALRLADTADELTGAAFTGDRLAHELKADGSPVSETDVAVERRIAGIVADERPGDGMLGEEVGESGPTARRWIVDGIDGTVLFVAGVLGWSTQIALEVDGRPVVGVVTSGAGGRRWWAARGMGAWCAPARDAPPVRIAVSGRQHFGGGRYTLIPPLVVLSEERRAALAALGGDATYVAPSEHGALFVADGRVEACVQLGGGPWDFAGLAVIVDEAGGRFSDLSGAADIYDGGPAVFSNGPVHDAVLARLAG